MFAQLFLVEIKYLKPVWLCPKVSLDCDFHLFILILEQYLDMVFGEKRFGVMKEMCKTLAISAQFSSDKTI